MPTTPNMNLVLPTENASDDVWDTMLNTLLELVDSHDHTAGKGVKVPTAGINVNADLTFASFAALALKAVRFTAQASLTGFNTGIAFKTDNEFYVIKPDGTQVKVTNGGQLNLAIVGGITGDYSSTNADVDYSDATKTFRFWKDNTTVPESWAKLASEEHKIYPTGNGANSVNLKAPAGLGASYDVTLPSALPGSTSLLTISSAGAVATTRSPSIDGLTITDPAVKHGEITLTVGLSDATFGAGGAVAAFATGTPGFTLDANGEYMWIPIKLPVGSRLKKFTVGIVNTIASGVASMTGQLVHVSTAGQTALGSGASNGSNGAQIVTETLASPHTIVDNSYFIKLTWARDGVQTSKVHTASVVIDRV